MSPEILRLIERRGPASDYRLKVAVLAAWALAAGLAAVRLAGHATDDIFITYRYALNLADGAGFVFNPGERVFAASDPAVVFVLAAAHRCTGIAIPLLGSVLTGATLVALSTLVFLEMARRGRLIAGIVGGSLIVVSPFLWLGQGAGPLFALTLLVASAVTAERRSVLSGVLAGLAMWCRPDAAVGCAVLAAMLAARSVRAGIRFAVAAGLLLLGGLLAAQAYFGTFLPVTLSVKRKLAVAGNLSPTVGSFWSKGGELFLNVQGPLASCLLVIGLAGAVAIALRGQFVERFLVSYAVALAVLYSLFRLPFFVWYVAPIVVAILVGVGWGLASVFGWAARIGTQPVRTFAVWTVCLLGSGLLMGTLVANELWVWRGGIDDWRAFAYRAAGEWLAANAPPDADVAADEVGMVGYYSGRRVTDLEGLVTPASVPFAAVGDQLGAFLASPTRFVMFNDFSKRGGTGPIVGRPWFSGAYRIAATLSRPSGGSAVLYERIPGSLLPEKRLPVAHRNAGGAQRAPPAE